MTQDKVLIIEGQLELLQRGILSEGAYTVAELLLKAREILTVAEQ